MKIFQRTTTALSVSICMWANGAIANAQNFYLPYPKGDSYPVTQSWGGATSHNARNKALYSVDFAMPIGALVAATAQGTVVSIEINGEPGGDCDSSKKPNHVIISHGNNVASQYLHLDEVNVQVGQSVAQGEIIGKAGNTGWTCSVTGNGSHLHFSFQEDNGQVYATTKQVSFTEVGGEPIVGKAYKSQNTPGLSVPAFGRIISSATNKALDGGGSPAYGDTVYPSGSPSPSNPLQIWKFGRINGSTYMITNLGNSKALDGGAENGKDVYVHPQPNAANPFHQWEILPLGNKFAFRNVATGRVLDSGGSNGTDVYLHGELLNWNNHHAWEIVPHQ